MARAPVIAMAIIFFSFATVIFSEVNNCYCGDACIEGDELKSYDCSAFIITNTDMDGVGHRMISFNIVPIIDPGTVVKDSYGNTVNVSDPGALNRTLTDLAAYKSPSDNIIDWTGFFGFALSGLRLFINTLFLPIVGLPTFLYTYFYVPLSIAYLIGFGIYLVIILELIIFITGRFGWL